MKIHNFEQRSPEWFEIRKGKMTASNAQAIGNAKAGLTTYINEIVTEVFTTNTESLVDNIHTQRGKEYEPFAIQAYELETGNKVDQVGFIEFSETAGCSPDGLIGEDGGIEIKCPIAVKHMRLFLEGAKAIEKKYLWQIQMSLLITGRKWWDFVSYNMDYINPLFIHRVERDEEMIQALHMGMVKGDALIRQNIEILKKIHGDKKI